MARTYKLALAVVAAAWVLTTAMPAQATSRIKDLANVEGVRQNQLIGYGLVVGLNGTGDTINNSPFTRQSLTAMLERLGVNIRGQTLRTGNVAAVMVTSNLPAFSTQGTRIDVTVSALGDAKSLQGGTLLVTPLLGADGNVYAVAGGPDATTPAGPVLLDYGHNAAALAATGQMVAEVWPGATTAAITLPGDRRDDLIAESAQAIAARFATVVLYEDQDLRGRRPGEMRGLIEATLRQVRPDIRVAYADGPDEALRTAVSLAAGGPVLFIYEKLTAALAALQSLGATPWPEEDLLGKLVSGQVLDDIAREFAQGAAPTMPLPESPSQRELSS